MPDGALPQLHRAYFSSFCYILVFIFSYIAYFRYLICPISCKPGLSCNHFTEVVRHMCCLFLS